MGKGRGVQIEYCGENLIREGHQHGVVGSGVQYGRSAHILCAGGFGRLK